MVSFNIIYWIKSVSLVFVLKSMGLKQNEKLNSTKKVKCTPKQVLLIPFIIKSYAHHYTLVLFLKI